MIKDYKIKKYPSSLVVTLYSDDQAYKERIDIIECEKDDIEEFVKIDLESLQKEYDIPEEILNQIKSDLEFYYGQICQ